MTNDLNEKNAIPEESVREPETSAIALEEPTLEGENTPEVEAALPEAEGAVSEVAEASPETSVEFPETSVELPETSVEFPETSVEFPETSVEFPETSVEFPETSVELPETSVELPETSVELHETSVELPETSVETSDEPVELPREGEDVPEYEEDIPESEEEVSEADEDDDESEEEIAEADEDDDESEEEVSEADEDDDESEEDDLLADVSEKDMTDYSGYTRREIVQRLRKLLDENDYAEAIKSEVNALRVHFYRQLTVEQGADLQTFLDEGGNEEDYEVPVDELEETMKQLMERYREMLKTQRYVREREQQQNLLAKQHIIEELRELTAKGENIGDNFQAFRDLQTRWRNIGLVPQSELPNLRDTYHHYVEAFYDFMKINKELRDLDFKRNLLSKTELCEKAEALAEKEPVIDAFRELQTLHEQWHEIGPVPKENRIEIWERFKAASNIVNKRHQQHHAKIQEKRRKVHAAKELLYGKTEEIINNAERGSATWDKSAHEIREIQKEWNTIGAETKREDSAINRRFHTLCNRFFEQKRMFDAAEKEKHDSNMKLKIELCEKAEAIKDSTDWALTTSQFIELQTRWKEIGAVARRDSEAVWKRFRTACDCFFDRKDKHFKGGIDDAQAAENLAKKKALLKEIEEFELTGFRDGDFEQLKTFQQAWEAIGFVPSKAGKKINDRCRAVLNAKFEEVKAARREAAQRRESTTSNQGKREGKSGRKDGMSGKREGASGRRDSTSGRRDGSQPRGRFDRSSASSPAMAKVNAEREKLLAKYRELEADLIVWENNVGFFSKSKNAQAIVANVEKMIDKNKKELAELEEKIKELDKKEIE